jgi:hypothetical protein
MRKQYTAQQQREIDHSCHILDFFATGHLVRGSDGTERPGTIHDVLGFVDDDAVADALEEYADRLATPDDTPAQDFEAPA